MNPDRLTKRQWEILEAHARYFYLTRRQLVRLGIGTWHSVYKPMRALLDPKRKNNLLGAITFGPNPSGGDHERMTYLTPHGVSALVENPHCNLTANEIRHPRGNSPQLKDDRYRNHRESMVDFHMGFDQYAKEADLSFYVLTDFQFKGDNAHGGNQPLKQLTRVEIPDQPPLIPDLVLLTQSSAGEQFLYFVEVSQQSSDTKYILKQISTHRSAIRHFDDSLSNSDQFHLFGIRKLPRVLYAFAEAESLERVLNALGGSNDPFFAFALLSDLSTGEFSFLRSNRVPYDNLFPT